MADAVGGVTVHATRYGSFSLKKGTVIGPAEVAALAAAGIDEIVVVRLEDGDVSEDAAASNIAAAVAGEGITIENAATGRANLFAAHAGILMVDREKVDRINRVDEAVTFATLPALKAVVAGEMVATVKLIPFGIESRKCDAAVSAGDGGALRIAPYVIKRVGIVSTLLPGLPMKVIDKALAVTAKRLEPTGASIIGEIRIAHDKTALTDAIGKMIDLGAELVIVFGASAIADRRDVIPSAIECLGGHIECFGMPVDPGNLLLIGSACGAIVLGAPGCARSPAENGFDWVLMRLLAGLPVTRADVVAMGVGGLLMEIVSRPQPRIPVTAHADRDVAIVILAAGRSTRMGGPNKLLAKFGGETIVRIVARQALASKASRVIVVTGHQAAEIEHALQGLNVTCVHNPIFAQGLASSLKAGIGAVPSDAGAAIVTLGDMPLIDMALIDRLIDAHARESGGRIVVPVNEGRRGNPVLWSRHFFNELMALDGDVGARHVIALHQDAVIEVPVEGAAAFIDIDTPEALAELVSA
ncbi:MAG TPA: molybdopterin-binding/glycosyltransferase family 2 protein [Afipia sp.]